MDFAGEFGVEQRPIKVAQLSDTGNMNLLPDEFRPAFVIGSKIMEAASHAERHQSCVV